MHQLQYPSEQKMRVKSALAKAYVQTLLKTYQRCTKGFDFGKPTRKYGKIYSQNGNTRHDHHGCSIYGQEIHVFARCVMFVVPCFIWLWFGCQVQRCAGR
jgi:hypothetical protein